MNEDPNEWEDTKEETGDMNWSCRIREGPEHVSTTGHMEDGLNSKNNRMSLESFNEGSYRARRAFKRSLLSGDWKEKEQEKGEDLLEDSGKLLWERYGSLNQDYGSVDVNKCLDSKNT